MKDEQLQLFGGDWTQQKLDKIRRYLVEWAKVMKNQRFQRVYIDAFAGTGYREAPSSQIDMGFFAKELAEDEPQKFLDGSAKIALRIEPPFHQFVFIERSSKRFNELLKLKEEFPRLADRIDFRQGDCNNELRSICQGWDSRNTRGVLFLDPFGMQVDWVALESVARTQAIDVWILFPLGIGVNRMLPRSGKVPDTWRARLDRFFGTTDWYEAFYRPAKIRGLFGTDPLIVKVGTCNAIAEYYLERLRTIFPAVADNPRVLSNSRNTPLFLLCFAAGNPSPKATQAALRISQYILGKL